MPRYTKGSSGGRTLRIIGGRWRGRTLPVPPIPGLRPTPNRLRETLFNWLQPQIPGACCLDAFAGTGMLGLEAVSRGARSAILIEKNRQLYRKLQAQKRVFLANEVQIFHDDALHWLQGKGGAAGKERPQTFDCIFLDPPFHCELIARSCHLLLAQGLIAETGWVYTESEPGLPAPSGWQVHREARSRHVQCRLIQAGN